MPRTGAFSAWRRKCWEGEMLGRNARGSTLFVGDDEYVHLRRPSLGHPLPSRAGMELHGLASWLVGDKFKICQIFQIISDQNNHIQSQH